MEIYADKFGVAKNFAAPFTELVKNLNNGDTILFENKEYHFFRDYCQSRVIHMTNTDSFKNPQKYFAMLFENLEDITIDGRGATFVIHGDMCSLALLNCKNFVLKNFTIRYASPSNVELNVKEVKGNSVTYEIPESTLWYVDNKDVVFFEQSPFTKKNYWQFKNDENSWNGVCHSGRDVYRTLHFKGPFSLVKSVERLSLTELKIKYWLKRSFKAGETYTFSQNKNRNTCGAFFNYCDNISVDNVKVNYLAGFGWLTQMCKDVSFTNMRFEPDENHHVSAFADLIHVCGCKGDIKIDNIFFSHPHDDAINIHGAFLRFNKKLDDNTAVFEFVHNQQGGYSAFNVGDKARLYYRSNLQPLGKDLTVKAFEDDIDNKKVTVTFEEALPNGIEDVKLNQSNVVIENITYCPNVEISNCEFVAIPTRGILCTTSGKVKIHDNYFEDVAMANIFVSNDAADWYESGPVRDMEIYNNKFVLKKTKQYEQLNCPGVLVKPITLGRRVTEPVHKNIRIHDNHFIVGRDRAIKAIGVDGLVDENNKIEKL